jgi:hypothetical protein
MCTLKDAKGHPSQHVIQSAKRRPVKCYSDRDKKWIARRKQRKPDKKDSLRRVISKRNVCWTVKQHKQGVVCAQFLHRLGEPGLEIKIGMVGIRRVIQNALAVSL